ncbi:MAG: hypothetical protein Q9O62_08035 [Ardenticatenia bacterium]|nr:hypothetical protein [Ardenticatenia bacterium]
MCDSAGAWQLEKGGKRHEEERRGQPVRACRRFRPSQPTSRAFSDLTESGLNTALPSHHNRSGNGFRGSGREALPIIKAQSKQEGEITMAEKTYHLDAFPKGYYMSWFVTTQAAFEVKVKLFDETKKVYFDGSRQSTEIKPPLAQGADFIKGDKLTLVITEPQSERIDSSINTYAITTNDGTIVGYGYNICVEDQTDKDYNDVCISLVAWKHKG